MTVDGFQLAPAALAGLLAAIALVAAIRSGVNARRRDDAGWRVALLAASPFALAALLFAVLAPPPVARVGGALVIATADSPATSLLAPDERLVALPEAPAGAGGERLPDLGTALRRYPDTTALRVVGAGLEPRDHDAARGLALQFEPAPLPAGIVELQAPLRSPPGRRWPVRGRVEGGAGGTIELHDPAGTRRALQRLDAAGRFELAAVAGHPGRTSWRLRHRDAAGEIVEELALPLQVEAGAPLRLLVLAGGVNPENKYLRRWALDAGFELANQASVGGGVDIGDAVAPTAAQLARTDLLIVDARRWATLGPGGRATVRAAVRDGLGLLLRLDADPTAAETGILRDWGFTVAPAPIVREVQLGIPGSEPGSESTFPAGVGAGPDDTGPGAEPLSAAGSVEGSGRREQAEAAAIDTAPSLSRRPLRIAAADGVPLVTASDGEDLAVWRGDGRGRVALWNIGDSHRLQLSGRGAAYGELWAEAVARLARAPTAAGDATPASTEDDVAAAPADRGGGTAITGADTALARVGERRVFCGIDAGMAVLAADGVRVPLHVDPLTGAGRCAAFWPTRPGWHALQAGDVDRAVFSVLAPGAGPGLRAAGLRDATRALAAQAPAPAATGASVHEPGARWPWFLAWMLLAAACWWFERSRLGAGFRVPAR